MGTIGSWDGSSGKVFVPDGQKTKIGAGGCVNGVAADSSDAFWNEAESYNDQLARIFRLPMEGRRRPITGIFRMYPGQGAVAVQGDALWFLKGSEDLARTNRDGKKLVSHIGNRTFNGKTIPGMAMDLMAADGAATYVFLGHLNLYGYDLWRVPKTGDAKNLGKACPANMQGRGFPHHGPALSDTHVFWTSPIEGVIRRVPKDGSTPPEEIASRQMSPDHVVIAGHALYWINKANDTTPAAVMRLGLSGLRPGTQPSP